MQNLHSANRPDRCIGMSFVQGQKEDSGRILSLLKSRYAPSVMACLFGLMLLVIGVGSMMLNRVYQQQGQRTVAQVTYSGRTGGTHSSSYINYSFPAADGKDYTGRESGYSIPRGEQIAVEYLPEHPNWNRVAGAVLVRRLS